MFIHHVPSFLFSLSHYFFSYPPAISCYYTRLNALTFHFFFLFIIITFLSFFFSVTRHLFPVFFYPASAISCFCLHEWSFIFLPDLYLSLFLLVFSLSRYMHFMSIILPLLSAYHYFHMNRLVFFLHFLDSLFFFRFLWVSFHFSCKLSFVCVCVFSNFISLRVQY